MDLFVLTLVHLHSGLVKIDQEQRKCSFFMNCFFFPAKFHFLIKLVILILDLHDTKVCDDLQFWLMHVSVHFAQENKLQ